MTNGVYVARHVCPGEGCSLSGRLKWTKAAPIYDHPAPKARRVGMLKAGEWVVGVDTQFHFVPSRGVVQAPNNQTKELATGQVVYTIDYHGEGYLTLWRSGTRVAWAPPEIEPGSAEIAWDPLRPDAPEPVLWVLVKRTSGALGWVRDLEGVRCGGMQDRDPDCPPLP